jgi:hypothetical protein
MITRDEWLSALDDATAKCDPDAVTVRELAALLGVERKTAYLRVVRLVETGRAVATFKTSVGPSGLPRRVPAYKLVEASKARRK